MATNSDHKGADDTHQPHRKSKPRHTPVPSLQSHSGTPEGQADEDRPANKRQGRHVADDSGQSDKRRSGLDVVGDVAWGSHFCQFYESREDLLDVLVPYFRAGLEANEFCMWVTCEPLSAEEAKAALRAAVPDLTKRMAREQMEILDYRQWYVRDGKFNADKVLQGWVDKLQAALRQGFEGLRLTGNTFWLEKSLWKSFSDYEAAVDSVIGKHRMLALCTYSLPNCGAFEMIDVVRNHQFALIRQGKRWEMLQSMQRAAVKAALRDANERLQAQTEELQTQTEELRAQSEELQAQTGELTAANEELREQEQALETSLEESRRTAERLNLLSDTAVNLLAAEEPQGVIEDLCRRVMEYLDCQAFFNFLVDPQADRLRLNACAGIPGKERKKIEWLNLGAAVCGCVVRDGQRIVAEHIPDSDDDRTALVKSYGIKAYACHPILVGSKVLGTLSFGTKTRETFAEDEVSLMKTVTDLVAIAVQRQQVQQALRDRESELRRWTEQLEEKVAERTVQLTTMVDRLQDEVVRRVLAENKLRKHSQMLESFFQHTITPLAFLDRRFNFMRVNEAYAQAGGKDPSYFVGKNHFHLYPHEENRAIFERVVRTKQPYRAFAKPFTYPDDPQRVTYWNWQLTPLLNSSGQVHSLVLNLQDVTERQKAYEELEQRTRQLQHLAMELSQAEDRERKRLAEILHDDLQQILAAAKFHLGILSSRIKTDGSVRDLIGQLNEMLKEAIDKSRSLSHELSPAVLYQGDLGETFEWLARQLQAKHGLTVHVEVHGQVDSRSEAIKPFLYRTAQEMLFNVVKHAKVHEARLRIKRTREQLWLTISDQGKGFDPKALCRAAGFGLLSIRERVELLGGRMRIRSIPDRGSTFLIAVPDRQEAQTQVTQADGRATPGKRRHAEQKRPERLRVLLVDDHKVMREGLASLLDEQPDMDVVGQAGNGREAVEQAHKLQPDVIIMDASMPVMSGDEATRQIKLHLPKIRVIALSMFDEPQMSGKMRKAGAEVYLLKSAPSDELLAAIRGLGPKEQDL